MPSNAELIKSIEAEAKAKGVEADTTDLKNDQLASLLSELKAVEVKKIEVIEAPEFTVATGKAITSKRGILSDGDEICVKDLAGGQKAFDSLLKSKHIV